MYTSCTHHTGRVLTRTYRNKGLGPADEGRVQSLTTQLLAKLDAYEVILAKQKYLAGDVSDPSHLTHVES